VVTYTILLQNMLYLDREAEAKNLWQEMKFNLIKPDNIAYQILITYYLQNKKGRIVRQLFDEMKFFHVRPTVEIYDMLIKASDRGLDVGNAEDFIGEKRRLYPEMKFSSFDYL